MATRATWSDDERDEHASRTDEHLALISGQLTIQGEQIGSILKILTAAQASDGPSLAEKLVELISRFDNQSTYIKELTVVVAKLAHDLPLDLVAAIDDNLDVARRKGGDRNGDGRA